MEISLGVVEVAEKEASGDHSWRYPGMVVEEKLENQDLQTNMVSASQIIKSAVSSA